MRRSPNYIRFILTGAVLGFAVGGAIAVFGPALKNYSMSTAVAFFGAFLALIGAVLGGLLAIAADRSRGMGD